MIGQLLFWRSTMREQCYLVASREWGNSSRFRLVTSKLWGLILWSQSGKPLKRVREFQNNSKGVSTCQSRTWSVTEKSMKWFVIKNKGKVVRAWYVFAWTILSAIVLVLSIDETRLVPQMLILALLTFLLPKSLGTQCQYRYMIYIPVMFSKDYFPEKAVLPKMNFKNFNSENLAPPTRGHQPWE